MKNLQVTTQIQYLTDYITLCEQGKIQVPHFQRGLIWDKDNKINLFDSLRKGYPIGSFLLWKQEPTPEPLFGTKALGEYEIPAPSGEFYYVLDGYQRLSTLLDALINPERTALTRIVTPIDPKNYYGIYYDLENDEFNYFTSDKQYDDIRKIPIYKFIDGKEFFTFQRRLAEKKDITAQKIDLYLERFEYLSNVFLRYTLPSIKIEGGDLSEAQEIFARLNSMGQKISKDAIFSALSYNKGTQFRLDEKINNILDTLTSLYNFEGLDRDTIVNCILSAEGTLYVDREQREKTEQIVKGETFPLLVDNSLVSIEKAVKFLFERCYVWSYKLLPYTKQLVLMSYFYYQVPEPSNEQLEELRKWFWQTTYTNYFTKYSNMSKNRLSLTQFSQYIKGASDTLLYIEEGDDNLRQAAALPEKINMGSARSKAATLFLLQHAYCDINPEQLDTYRANKLFYDKGNTFENTVYSVQRTTQESQTDLRVTPFYRSKDISGLIGDTERKLEHHFITNSMQQEYAQGRNAEKLLQERLILIQKAEKEFIQQLGLIPKTATETTQSIQ